MSWVPGPYMCPTRCGFPARKDLRALGALWIDDNQAFATANRALLGADQVLASHRPCQQTTRIVSPMNLIESKSQNGSEMVKNFAIIVQGDLRVRQGTVTVNVFRYNDFRPKYQLAGYLH